MAFPLSRWWSPASKNILCMRTMRSRLPHLIMEDLEERWLFAWTIAVDGLQLERYSFSEKTGPMWLIAVHSQHAGQNGVFELMQCLTGTPQRPGSMPSVSFFFFLTARQKKDRDNK